MSIRFYCLLSSLVLLSVLVESQKFPEDPRVNEFVKGLKDLAADAIKGILPRALPLVYEAELSLDCMSSALRMVRDVQQLEEWAVTLLDASVKVPLGLLDGNSLHLGEYDECLSVHLQSGDRTLLRGQYCTLEVRPPEFFTFPPEHRKELYNQSIIPAIIGTKTALGRFARLHYGLAFLAFRIGVCVPSTCTPNDIENIANTFLKTVQFTSKILNCETKLLENIWTEDQFIIGIILATAVLLTVVGTAVTILFSWSPTGIKRSHGLVRRVAEAFSLDLNTRALFGVGNESNSLDNSDRLPFLAGIRIIGLVVLIMGFGFGFPYLSFWHKLGGKVNHLFIRSNFWFGIFGNATIPMETLIFSSGLLFGYQCFGPSNLKGRTWRPVKVFLKLVAKCLLFNAMAISLFLMLPLMGDGPQWTELVLKNVAVCRKTAWRNFLFIQNYWPFTEVCMFTTSMLTIVVFCASISTVIAWLLIRQRIRFAMILSVVAILASCISAGTVNALERFPPALALPVLNGHTLFEMFSLDLIRPYMHLCSYCIGLITGWFLGTEITIKKRSLKAMAWCVVIGGLCLVFYIPYNFPYEGDTYRILAALYAGSYRTIWCISIGVFCILCNQGSGSFMESLVSWTAFVRLDRLTWHTFLTFPIVMFYYNGQTRQLVYLRYMDIFMLLFGFACISYIFAFILYIIFTAPAHNISNIICHRLQSRKRIQPETKDSA